MVKELIEGIVETSNYFFPSDTGFLIPSLKQRKNCNTIRILNSCCFPSFKLYFYLNYRD